MNYTFLWSYVHAGFHISLAGNYLRSRRTLPAEANHGIRRLYGRIDVSWDGLVSFYTYFTDSQTEVLPDYLLGLNYAREALVLHIWSWSMEAVQDHTAGLVNGIILPTDGINTVSAEGEIMTEYWKHILMASWWPRFHICCSDIPVNWVLIAWEYILFLAQWWFVAGSYWWMAQDRQCHAVHI